MDRMEQIGLGYSLIEHWKNLSDGQGMPAASTFRPEYDLEPLTPYILALEIDRDQITMGTVGKGHDKRLNVDPTGHSYLDMVPPERRDVSIMRVQTMLQHICGARIEVEEEFDDGRRASTLLTVAPFAADHLRPATLVVIAPPNTLSDQAASISVPFLSRPFKSFEYLDLGYGCPSSVTEKLLGVRDPSPDDIWPDLKSLINKN